MRIGIVTPAPPDSRSGNRITAVRWAKILRQLGNVVSISQSYDGESYDLLVALHARRSHPSIRSFRRALINAPVIVALTGTDLYRDIRRNHPAQKSLDIATRIVVLQPRGIEELRPGWRGKTRVIYQSVEEIPRLANKDGRAARITSKPARGRRSGHFDVCVIGHLRAVKDPFRTAMAARLLPDSSRIRVAHIGAAQTEAMMLRARHEMQVNQRYHWLGEQTRSRVRRILAKSHLCVLSSRIEGGANALSEAIVASVPILASRNGGSVGILGEDYPGLFDVGDTEHLARLLSRAEKRPEYVAELKARGRNLVHLFDPAREERAWADLISELFQIERG